MTLEIWLTFIVTASIILVIPGPTIIFVVGQSLTHGKRASLPLSAGVISGDALCIFLSLLGLSTILSLFSAAFLIFKYTGAVYLVYLGIKMIRSNLRLETESMTALPYDSGSIFRDVFLVNALNPKGIIFYSAFMPQFVNPQQNIFMQFLLLSLTFLILALINVLAYSLLAARTNQLFKSRKFTNTFNLTGGICLICAGLYSAAFEQK